MPLGHHTKLKDGRARGWRIDEVCRIVKQLGPCTYQEVGKHMANYRPNGRPVLAAACCARAVAAGLLSVDKSTRPATFNYKSDVRLTVAPAEKRQFNLQNVWR